MKKLLLPIFLLLIFGTAFSQQGTYNPIYGKQDFKDTVKLSKLKNNAGLNYILSTDTAGRIIKVINPNGTPFCTTTLLSGSIIWVNGFNFSNTKLTYQIGCQLDTSSASNFSITAADTSDRYTIVWADTLGNLGTTDGTVGAVASIPTVDPRSQILLATYFIPANSTQPQLLSNTVVYKENVEWVGFTNVAGGLFNYLTTPYQGIYSTYLPGFVNLDYINYSSGTDYNKSSFSYLSLHIKLSSVFTSSNTIRVSLRNSSGAIGYATINAGQYGLNGDDITNYQLLAIPIPSFSPVTISNIFNSISFQFLGSGSAVQIDNVILQTGGENQGSIGVQSVNGQTGNVVITHRFNFDSSYNYTLVNGVITDSVSTLKRTLVAQTGITITPIGVDSFGIASTGGTGSSQFRDTTSNNLYLPDDYPKLGIGTLNPTAKLHLKSSVFHEIQFGETPGAFTDAGFFTNMDGSPTNLINLSRSSDGVFTDGIFNYTTLGGVSSMGYVSRSGHKWVTGVLADNGMSLQNSGLFIGVGTTPNASARLEVNSTTQGVLFPHLTTSQMNAVSSPYAGLIITNTDSLNRLFIYTGTAWKGLAFTDEGGGVGNDSAYVNILNLNPSQVAFIRDNGDVDTLNFNSIGSSQWRDTISGIYTPASIGNVGMGTVNPLNKLHVKFSSDTFSGATVENTEPTGISNIGMVNDMSDATAIGTYGSTYTAYPRDGFLSSTNNLSIISDGTLGGGGVHNIYFRPGGYGNLAMIMYPTNNVQVSTNLGIGKVPSLSLDITSPDNVYARLTRPSNANDAQYIIKPTGALSSSNPQFGFGLLGGSSYFTFYRYDGSTVGSVINISATANRVGIMNTAPSEVLDVTGNILASGTITPSDIRYKENIKPVNNALSLINALNPSTYNYNLKKFPNKGFNSGKQFGLVAQEVEKVIPEIVKTYEDGFKGVNYAEIIPILVKGMQEQQAQIKKLQMEIKKLKNK